MAVEDPEWQVGDVFAGVGWLNYLPGQYWVFDSTGTPKLLNGVQQKVVDVWSKKQGSFWGVSTGCGISPDGSLYTTSFVGLSVARFAAAAPHARTLANTISYTSPTPDPVTGGTWSVFAIESIAFDHAGNYYVGGQGPPPNSPSEELLQKQRPGFIFKFSPTHALLGVYEVPNGNRGVDQLDVGSDPGDPTIFYTSEDTTIRVFRPNHTGAFRTQEIKVREQGQTQPLGGSLYAIRALPPHGEPDDPQTPINESLQPSGFLVASSTDVLRINRNGEIVRRYVLPASDAVSGQRFALNITPDGQSFWTATYPGGSETYPPVANPPAGEPNSVGYLLKFHIPTGTLLAKTQLAAGAVWGLCVKREYTASVNTCFVTDQNGRSVDADGDGQPDTATCVVPRDCVAGDTHEQCRLPGAPIFGVTIPSRDDQVGTTVDSHPVAASLPLATSPTNLTLTYTASNLPAGIQINPHTGAMSGTIDLGASREAPYTVTVTATDSQARRASTSFQWTVRPLPAVTTNTAPVLLAHPDGSTFNVTVAAAHQLTFTAFDNESDAIFVAAQYRLAGAPSYSPGLPPGYSLTGTVDPGQYSPARPLPDTFAQLGMLAGGSTKSRSITLVNSAPAVVTPVGTYEVWLAIMDVPQGSAWCFHRACDADEVAALAAEHDWLRPAQNRQFTIAVRNGSPVVTVANQRTLVGTSATYQILAVDPEGHTLTYAVSGLPSSQFSVSGNIITANPTVVPPGGSYTASVTVSDPYGGSVTTTFTWTIFTNRAPVCTGAQASQALWPPNHMMVPITVVGVTDADGDPITISVTAIRQDEPVFTPGSGKTSVDGRIEGATAFVRAERSGVKATPGDGRIYEILFTATDGKDSCSGMVMVGVPHDQGQMRMPVPSPGRWNSLTGLPIPQ